MRNHHRPATLDASALHLLHRAGQCAEVLFANETGRTELTPRQYAILVSVAQNPDISQTGLVDVTLPGQATPQQLGQLTMANFVNEAGLQALGGNYFRQTAASGQPNVGVPGDTAFGIIQQGYVEASNVDPVTEITNLIAAQRAYEMNSKVIQAADQMSGTISNMRS